MLVSFSVSNFRSFSSEETFSLVASNRLSDSHKEHLVPIPDSKESVLRAGVLYGANGAGKSNLFKALQYVKSVALDRREKGSGTGREQFRLSGEADQNSNFDIQFMAQGKLYRFGFKVDDHRIAEEWLVQVTGGRDRVLFERVTDATGRVSVEIKIGGEKLKALATVGGPQNQSFLATVLVTLESEDISSELQSVLRWFTQCLKLISPEESYRGLGKALIDDPALLEFAGDYLRLSSTGVSHLRPVQRAISLDEVRSLAKTSDVPVSIMTEQLYQNDGVTSSIMLGGGGELLIKEKDENRFYHITVQALHETPPDNSVMFDLNQESDGTRRLLNLIPALHHSQLNEGVYFIDEIDRSLHPILVRTFLESFLKSGSGGHGQIIVTTHESNLLDQDLLRRDEIWFAEKDQGGSTRLYSLVDFKVRKDLEIRKHYLEGRFGAIPFFGDIDGLLAEKGRPE